MKDNGYGARLPGVDLNDDQLFFLSFGQVNCNFSPLMS